ncbi:putative oligopeptide/dipeptide ABC transporter, ATP-binding protein [Methanocella conradii HZ254]|uniref:Oligopeptide/dipeptide ABC transporter, ATP-binding protein n=1 Tax=Methanocella conradii (strain DSM 24694 / JCM 17849 / CGMCC 1.5162 / HZ254) TaxID=1041930 RepID=H8IAT3_METCZ|nr:ABC transporter ATP-binding protein [Methanocella conradii]AFD00588.1 putative oligopeptide/dipeptide ABC transporter, ATP-binding protein [Methanocella conradii HZ254]MDI6896285.1 ABC transporter ATP-binding protein [Methanocella conradii]
MPEVLVSIRGLKTNFYTYAGVVKALDGIDLDIYKGETIGLVGETGCGKSVTALSIIRLIQWPPGRIDEGSIIFNGKDLLKLPEKEMRKIRGNKISMIFQEPMNSFNPVFTIGDQIAEVIMLHQKMDKKSAWKKAVEMLSFTSIPAPERVAKSYPHELSGGMLQRAMISMALACQPQLLIADEPTTALDVTIEAQILDLMKNLKSRTNASILMITHDLGIIAEMCDRVGVMYGGVIVELADVVAIFKKPLHPYTSGLINAIPSLSAEQKRRLETIPGNVPNLINPPTGCRFHPRCSKAMDICKKEKPGVYEVEDGHCVSCFLYAEEQKK